jgi:cbb3-type cytochrome oxidase cytochrome c subunit
MSDLHLRILRGAARRARERLTTHRAAAVAPATEQEADADRRLEQAATAADAQLSQSMDRRQQRARTEPSVAELNALAAHARQRLALYRRRMYLGRGQANELAELERISHGAEDRARRARRGAG